MLKDKFTCGPIWFMFSDLVRHVITWLLRFIKSLHAYTFTTRVLVYMYLQAVGHINNTRIGNEMFTIFFSFTQPCELLQPTCSVDNRTDYEGQRVCVIQCMYFITQLHFDKERFDKDVLVKKDKQRFKAEPHDQKSMMKTSKLFKLCHSDKSPSELL